MIGAATRDSERTLRLTADRDLGRRRVTIGVLETSNAGAALRAQASAWAAEHGCEVERIIDGDELGLAILAELAPNNGTTAIVTGAIGETGFIAIRKEGGLAFSHFIRNPAIGVVVAEIEKALKHVVRMGSLNSAACFLFADATSREALAAVLTRTIGKKAVVLQPDLPAGDALAGYLTPAGSDARRTAVSPAAFAAAAAIILAVLGAEFLGRTKLRSLTAERTVLASRQARLFERAVRIEGIVAEARSDPGQRGAGPSSTVGTTLELMHLLSARLPMEAALEEVHVIVASQDETAQPYIGLRGGAPNSPAIAAPKFMIRGRTRGLGDFAQFTKRFESGPWRMDKIGRVEEMRTVEATAGGLPADGYAFEVVLTRQALL